MKFKNSLFLELFLSQGVLSKIILLVFLVSVAAALELVGLAAVFPFLQLVSNPSTFREEWLFIFVQTALPFLIEDDLMQLIGMSLVGFFILSMIARMFSFYIQSSFVFSQEAKLSTLLFELLVHTEFIKIKSLNKADVAKLLINEVAFIITKGLFAIVSIFSNIILVGGGVFILYVINPVALLVAGGSGLLFFSMVFFVLRPLSSKLGVMREAALSQRFSLIDTTLLNIRDVILSGHQKSSSQSFETASHLYAKTLLKFQIIGQFPKFILEMLAIGIGMIWLFWEVLNGKDVVQMSASFGMYVIVGYRLLPLIQQIYYGLVNISYSIGCLAGIEKLLLTVGNDFVETKSNFLETRNRNLSEVPRITLSNVTFSYGNDINKNDFQIKGVDLKIEPNSSVAFVGFSGSGKSTLADLISGLLLPSNGTIEFDGMELNKSNRALLQTYIAYLPQTTTLYNGTIFENVLHGFDNSKTNLKRALDLIDKVNLSHLVLDRKKFIGRDIGADGIQLSGGERQRVGLIRAIFKKPKILILDEFTSALDLQSEIQMLDLVRNINTCTCIYIAHRLNSQLKSSEYAKKENSFIF